MGRQTGRRGLRPGEGALAVTLFVLFLAGGLGRGLTRSVAYAGFLARYPATDIPYVYVAVGAVLAAVMPFYLRLAGRTPVAAMAAGSMGLLGAGQLGLFALRPLLPAVVDLVLPVWYESLSIVLALSLWAVAGHVLDVAQGKRLLGPLGAGIPVGFLLAGSATPLLVARLGTSALIALGAAALLAAGVVAAVLGRRPAPSTDVPGRAVRRAPDRPAPLRAVLADPYVRVLVGLFVCWTLTFYVADYMFYERSSLRYPQEAALARFLGQYSAVMGAFMLVSGLVVAPWVLRRFGARPAAYAMPAVLGLGVLPSVVIGMVAGASPAIFWPAYATKVGHYAVDAVDRSARSVLYQPLRPQVRLRVQALGEGLGAALTTAAVGVLLLVGVQVFHAGVVAAGWLMLTVVVAWVALAAAAGRMFPARMAAALDGRRLTGAALVLDATALRILRRNLSSGRPEVVVYALDRLEEADDPGLGRLVLRLLEHPEPLVRAEAVRRTAGRRDGDVLAALRARLGRETDPDVVARLVTALTEDGGPADVEAVADVLDRHALDRSARDRQAGPGGDPLVLQTAAAGLLRQPDRGQARGVPARVQAWRSSGDRGLALSADLALATGLGDPLAWRRVVEAVHVPALRERATNAVVAGVAAADPGAFGALAVAIRDEDAAADNTGVIATGGSGVRLGRLARIAGRVAHPVVNEALALHVTTPGPASRSQVLAALVRAGWSLGDGPDGRVGRAVQAQLAEESQIALTVLAVESGQAQAGPVPGGAALAERVWLLRSALAIERVHTLRRVLSLAAIRDVSGAVGAALAALPADALPTERQRQYLSEVLESVGERRLLGVVRALCDPETSAGYLAEVRRQDPVAVREATSPLARTRLLDWTRTCLAAAATLGGPAPVALFGRAAAVSSTVERVIVLKGVGLFRQVPDDVLASVAEAVTEVQLTTGERLFSRGDTASTMYVVVTGAVHVHDGDRSVSLLGPGEVVGELALLDDALRSASVTAAEDTLLLCLDRHAFDELLADHPAIATGVIRMLAARLRARTDDVLAAERRR